MASGIRIDLEVVTSGRARGRLEHASAKSHHLVVCGVEIVDPKIQVDLLCWQTVWPIGSNVVRRELYANAGLSVDHDHVPVVIPVDVTAEDTGPERALGVKVRRIERHDLMPDFHALSLRGGYWGAETATPSTYTEMSLGDQQSCLLMRIPRPGDEASESAVRYLGRSVRVVPGVGVGYRSVLSSVLQRYFGDGERRLRWHRSACLREPVILCCSAKCRPQDRSGVVAASRFTARRCRVDSGWPESHEATPFTYEGVLADAGVGSRLVTLPDLDACPLPKDPLLAEMASSLRDAGHWAEIVDSEWRVVYTTDELRLAQGFMIMPAPLTLGMHMFGKECIATHELLPGGDGMIDIARERLASIGEWVVADTPGGHDALRSIVDPRLTDVVDRLVATNRTVASSSVYRGSGVESSRPVLDLTVTRIRDTDGRLVGTVIIQKPHVSMSMLAMLGAMGDAQHFATDAKRRRGWPPTGSDLVRRPGGLVVACEEVVDRTLFRSRSSDDSCCGQLRCRSRRNHGASRRRWRRRVLHRGELRFGKLRCGRSDLCGPGPDRGDGRGCASQRSRA